MLVKKRAPQSLETVRRCKTLAWQEELLLFLDLSDAANIYLISGFYRALDAVHMSYFNLIDRI